MFCRQYTPIMSERDTADLWRSGCKEAWKMANEAPLLEKDMRSPKDLLIVGGQVVH